MGAGASKNQDFDEETLRNTKANRTSFLGEKSDSDDADYFCLISNDDFETLPNLCTFVRFDDTAAPEQRTAALGSGNEPGITLEQQSNGSINATRKEQTTPILNYTHFERKRPPENSSDDFMSTLSCPRKCNQAGSFKGKISSLKPLPLSFQEPLITARTIPDK